MSPLVPYIFYFVGSLCFVIGTLIAMVQVASAL